MWYPFPMLMPLSLSPEPQRPSDISQTPYASGMIQMHMVPCDQRFFQNAMNGLADPPSLSIEDCRKFLLNRSVFDLVKVTHFLELTDPKLLGWYLSLPVEDRKLIQEEGGLHRFLQRHPALNVARQLVYVKQQVRGCWKPPAVTQTMSSNLNNSRRPTFYGVIQCPNCGTSCSSGAKICRRCSTPIQKEIPACQSEEEKELGLLPNNVKEELNLFNCSGHGGVQSVQVHHQAEAGAVQQFRGCQPQSFTTTTFPSTTVDCLVNLQDSFQSACGDTSGGHIGATEDSPGQQEAHFSKVQLLSQLWEEGRWQDGNNCSSVVVYKDPSAQTSFSLDMELEIQSQRGINRSQSTIESQEGESMANSISMHDQMADFPILDRETPPEYYSFNSTRMDRTEWNDTSINTSQLAEQDRDDSLSLMATMESTEQPSRPVEVEPPEASMVSSCAGDRSEYCDWTYDNCPGNLANEEEASRCELENNSVDYRSLMKEDGSILMYKASNEGTPDLNLTPPQGQTKKNQSGWSRESLSAPQTLKKEELSIYEESFMSISPGGAAAAVMTTTQHENGMSAFSLVNLNQTFDLSPSRVTEARLSTADHSTNTWPAFAKHDVLVGIDHSLTGCNQNTQTQGTATTDKSVITEVHMADLEYLTEEFIKLKFSQEELKELKEQMTSSAGGVSLRDGRGCDNADRGECDCGQRATRAELSLLALQYGMCQRHCWRRYYTSPEGDRLFQGTEGPPESLVKVLQVLEVDYREMRRQVLSGIPLDQLRPLSVDSQRITSGTSYVPQHIIDESLGNALSDASGRSSQQLQVEDARVEYVSLGGDGELNRLVSQSVLSVLGQDDGMVGRIKAEGPVGVPVGNPKAEDCRSVKAIILRHQQPEVNRRPRPGGTKDHNSSEAWFDAEEDLEPDCVVLKEGGLAEVLVEEGNGKNRVEGEKPHDRHTPKDFSFTLSTGVVGEKDQSSFLCVTDLPSDVTEREVMLWFEKYQASEVSISTFSNNLRVAIVTVSGPKMADSAVSEMDGCSMHGHTVHVAHICSPSHTGSQSQGQGRQTQQQQGPSASTKAGPSGDTPCPQDSKRKNTHITTPLMPLQLSLQKRTTVCDSPTASGTCVPQHYATMGSFDTLMARLSVRHPEAGRQRIVDALLEMRAKHQGFLSGLPLKTIVNMTSDLLTR
ncbi:RNA-binding protein 44-like isoform X3 [Salvelinus fontinalis]|uniref:RNA-binding protein 44-like isoform X3 n=1 Tax=Salvelinus fontinalis TaxID=8038 RepID=UPI00248569DC|nr:RNA-binding protein 44-like isoform X3 [Salvelinus fontinalis]